MKGRNIRKILSLLVCIVLLFSFVQPAFGAVVEDARPATTPIGQSADLIGFEMFGFKGNRIEFVGIPFDEPVVAGKYDYEMEVDMKNFSSNDRAIYFKPIAYDENATFVINGTPTDFNTAYRVELGRVLKGEEAVRTPCTIEVTSGDGNTKATYTLTFINKDLYDTIKVNILEENKDNDGKLISGVYQFTSINGFTTAEDCFMFVGKDRAIVFDALNGGGDNSRRGGDLKKTIYDILQNKFGVANPDDFPIDVALTHNHGDHYGMINTSTPQEYRLAGRGAGKGTIYWGIGDANSLSNNLIADPNTDVRILLPGDTIVGPDFGKGPIKFEVITIRTHTTGHLVYLYDNDADGQCQRSYLASGDAVGQGSYVFNHNNSNCIMPLFSRDMEKLWNRVKGLTSLTLLTGHTWQERDKAAGEMGKVYVEDMYIATTKVMENPFVGEFTTSSATAYYRELSYGVAGLWYNVAGAYDFGTKTNITDLVTPATLLDAYLFPANSEPTSSYIKSYTALSTAQTCTVADASPLVLMAEAFGEDAAIKVSLNGKDITNTLADVNGRGKKGYRVNILASDDAALNSGVKGVNVLKLNITDAASKTAKEYTIYIRTIKDDALYPLPDIKAQTYNFSTKPAVPNKVATLNEVFISSFKGGRLEPYKIDLDTPIIPNDRPFDPAMLDNRELSATIDWSSRTSKVVYIMPEASDPTLFGFKINGVEGRYPIPIREELVEGDNVFTITLGEGEKATTYTLTIHATPLWDEYDVQKIEKGVYRIRDCKGTPGDDDMYLFAGEDKAMLFDSGMGDGDLRACVKDILVSEGLSENLPIEVVVTHAHGDHYGKVNQFSDCQIYWPVNDAVTATFADYKIKRLADGDTLVGPKFGGKAITFECIEVVGHTDGSMCYLYDNLAQKALTNNYLVSGDAVGQGKYVFNFGATKQAVASFLRDITKMEAKLQKFTEGFYDPNVKINAADVSGVYFMTGHSWQETTDKREMYSPMWDAPNAMQGLAGIAAVRDMRIAAEKVVNGEAQGRLYTRATRSGVEVLRQLFVREASLWYNGWHILPTSQAELSKLTLNTGLVTPTADPAKYTAVVANDVASVNLQASTDYYGSKIEGIGTKELQVGDNNFTITVTSEDGTAKKDYEITVTRRAPMSFTDVEEADWFYEDVKYAWDNLLMNGMSDTQFGPKKPLTRAMLVTVLYRIAGAPSVAGMENPFNDVDADKYYTDAVIWAAENKVVEGYPGDVFKPDANITREQVATIMYRYQKAKGEEPVKDGDAVNFADGDKISSYAKEAVEALAGQGILNGKPGNLFDPQGNATRAEISVILHRFLK